MEATPISVDAPEPPRPPSSFPISSGMAELYKKRQPQNWAKAAILSVFTAGAIQACVTRANDKGKGLYAHIFLCVVLGVASVYSTLQIFVTHKLIKSKEVC